ncbi:MAG: DUF1778 domain-containing protein [Promicromonosporaceae bacterium]|nr:DUF1778 domain-containing protein [Promicromonosporaceae bacterium]
METVVKDSRLALRLTAEEKATIAAASAAQGRSLSDFTTQCALEKAAEILADQRTFHVPDTRWAEFEALLDGPIAPHPGVRDLFARPSVFQART